MPLTKIPQSMVEGFNTPTSYPADRTELANINGVLQPSAYLRETGREGVFKWVGTNQSANITADPNQGVYVPPASDLTGTSGAWVRTIDSAIQTKWFGTNGWQAAINLAATLGILTVIASGVHTLTSGSLQMRPSITLRGLPGARVTQANGANITHIVDMATFTANSCKLESLTIDGNWSNNNKPTNNSNSLVLLWDSNNVTIKDCSLISSTGNGIIIRNATRYLIEHNAINGVFIQGITVVRDIFNIPSYGKIINNEITSHGQLGIVVAYSDNVDIIGNVVNSSLVRTGLNVNTSGTTVTSVSGPFFTPDMVGRFIVLGGGFEFLITGFTSSTQLTVSPSAGSNTNTPAAIGQGDNFSIQGCNYVNVEGNISQSGVTLGFSVFSDGTRGSVGCTFTNNLANANGSAGFSVQCIAPNGVIDTQITNNRCYSPGMSTTAGAASFNVGIGISGGALADGFLIDGNMIHSFTSNMIYGISYGAGVGNKNTGTNLIRGFTTAAILNP